MEKIEKVMENHENFCNLKSKNPVRVNNELMNELMAVLNPQQWVARTQQ